MKRKKISKKFFFWNIPLLVFFFLHPFFSYAVDTDAPEAIVELSKSSPVGEGDVTITVTTSEKVVSVPTPLIFTDTDGESFEITLEGTVPSVSFEGTFTIDSNVAEGRGIFSFPEDALEDEAGNKGNKIINGQTIVIDRTSPLISGISIVSNPAVEGRIDISFISSELLSAKSVVTIEGSSQGLGSEKDNGDGSYTYSLTYIVPQEEGEGEGVVEIKAIDMAGNETIASESFSMDVFAPYAMIELSSSSPLGDGSFSLELTASKKVVSVPTPLRFTDSSGEVHEIELSGDVPGTEFSGTFSIDSTVSEGLGRFSLAPEALVDDSGNKGNSIISGQTTVIDKTPPIISDIKTIPNPAIEGKIDIDFISSEILSGNSSVLANGSSLSLGAGKDNGDGTYTYSLSYTVPTGEGEGDGALEIEAIDLAGNTASSTSTFNLDAFAPYSMIELSSKSPVGLGSVSITLETNEKVVSLPTPLRFKDNMGEVHNISLSGDVPGTIFRGEFTVNSSVAEGLGNFSLSPEALVDEYGNKGNKISSGVTLEIDKTPPVISDIKVIPNPSFEGKIDISFISSEILSGNSSVLANGSSLSLGAGKDNGDGTYTYSLSYTVPTGEGEGDGALEIEAIDLAGNTASSTSTFNLDAFAPYSMIELSSKSPVGLGGVSISLQTNEKVVSLPTPLRFTDSVEKVHEIVLSGDVPGTTFTGEFTIDASVAEGLGDFSLTPGALVDELGNKGNRIVSGQTVVIDRTPPLISDIKTIPNPAIEGKIDIDFISSEILSGNSSVLANGSSLSLGAGKDNGDGTYTYSLSYTVPTGEGEGDGALEIEAIDLAGNTASSTSTFNLDAFAPYSMIELSSKSPVGLGSVSITLETNEKVVSLPTPLRFKDNTGDVHNITLSGDVPGTIFTGEFTIDASVAEGLGNFSLAPETLVDEYGNRGNKISSGVTLEIDKTSPVISDIKAIPNPAIEGKIDISFISSEILSGNSSVLANGSSLSLGAGKDNGDGTYTYSLSYTVPTGEGEGEGALEIEAIDLAGNKTTASESFSMDVFAPYAMIELSSSSPLGDGSFSLELTVSKKVVSVPTPLRFTDSSGEVHEIELSGDVPGTEFSGTFSIDSTVSEGLGRFSLAPKALVDNSGNKGNSIINGQTLIIDMTPPSIEDLRAVPNPSSEGKIDISFISNEILSGDTVVLINSVENRLSSPQENEDGSFTYFLTYIVPKGEGEGEGRIDIQAVDMAGNKANFQETFSLDVFPPSAIIELEKPSPLSEGNVSLTLTTSKKVVSLPTPLRFTDSTEEIHEISLSGDVPGTIFTGEFTVDSSVSEGLGSFSLAPEALVDESGNKGNKIISGQTTVIDKTPPIISDIKTIPNPAIEGKIDISFISSEILSGNSSVLANGSSLSLGAGKDNGDGTYTYSLTYTVPAGEGEGEGALEIEAIDLAGNAASLSSTFNLDAFAPYSVIELSKPSPIGLGGVSISLQTNEKVVSLPTPLRFTDSVEKVHEIVLSGDVPGTTFTGEFTIDASVAEGLGDFSLTPGALVDELGNKGNRIVSGQTVVIDRTPPLISDIKTIPNPAIEGKIDIDFISSEILSGNSSVLANGSSLSLGAGKDNGDGTYTYSLSYTVPIGEGEGDGALEIEAIDLAGNIAFLTPTFNLDAFAPHAMIELSEPSPIGLGNVFISLQTNEKVFSLPTPLRFTDSMEEVHEIVLSGNVPGTIFTGEFTIDSSVAEGLGNFSLTPSALIDENGNSGNSIIDGQTVIIDMTRPWIKNLKITPNPSRAGRIDISFISSEILSGDSIILINSVKNQLTSPQKNEDGSFTYFLTYIVPEGEREGEGEIEIQAVDMAGNRAIFWKTFSLDILPPSAKIELEKPSPLGEGSVSLTLTTSKKVVSLPIILRFTDSLGKVHKMELSGDVPGTEFSGTFTVDSSVSEGLGSFSLAPEALVDESGNKGNSIISGQTVVIDRTPPVISDIKAIPNPAIEGKIDIKIISSEILSGNSSVLANGSSLSMGAGKDNGDGTYTYSLSYTVPTGEGEGKGVIEIEAIDLAENRVIQTFDFELDTFAPSAIIELSEPSPLGYGEVKIQLTTTEEVVSSPTPLRFTDTLGRIHLISLSGEIPGTTFTGVFEINSDVAEGIGNFSFAPRTLQDEYGNYGNRISSGTTVRIDRTPPKITDITAIPNPAVEGRIDISFISSEELSGNSLFIVNGKKQKISFQGVDNGDGTYTYFFSYLISEEIGEGEGELKIEGVDFAGNTGKISTVFNMDVFPPKAQIELSDPSPIGMGEVEVKVITSKKVVEIPGPFKFLDSDKKSHKIELKGSLPGTLFYGTFTVDSSVSDGIGRFVFEKDALVDEFSNSGNEIVSGAQVEIAFTPPQITEIKISPNKSTEGLIDISFVSSKLLSAASTVSVDGMTKNISDGKDNGDGTFTYSLSFIIPESEGEGTGQVKVSAVDLAKNVGYANSFFNLDVFSPKARIELKPPSPVGIGEIKVEVKTDEKVVSLPSPLRFIDSQEETHEIELKGGVPGTSFLGIFTVDENVSEGTGYFSFAPNSLIDEIGNSGNKIVYGDKIEIDKTSPVISTLSVKTNPSLEGGMDISFISSEILSGNSSLIVNGKKQKITSSGIDNGDGTYTYLFSYLISEEIGEGEGELKIEAVDLANNVGYESTVFNMDVFSPKAKIELSDPPPTGVGEIELKVKTDEKVIILPSLLRFTDSQEEVHEIKLKGEVPGTSFEGIFTVDENVSEGTGYFSFAPETLVDEMGNRGNRIVYGDEVEIDKTSPVISNLSVEPNPSFEGRIDINFISSEILSGNSSFIVNGKKQKITSSGIDNGDGTYTYLFSYLISEEIGEGEGELKIEAVDFAGNSGKISTVFNMDVFSPKAQIELSDPSPIGMGEVEVKVITSKKVVEIPASFRFLDSIKKSHKIELSGDVPGTKFSGTFLVDSSVSEGIGHFAFEKDALVDEFSNSGNKIVSGTELEIDFTPPQITEIEVLPNKSTEGQINISFISSELLSANSTVEIDDMTENISNAKDNGDGTFTYSLSFTIPETEGEGTGQVKVSAVDLAKNAGYANSFFNLDVFSPKARIELKPPSPVGIGEIKVEVKTDEKVVSLPSPLRFIDSQGKTHEILLKGEIPGTSFEGIFTVDENVSEGTGEFSFPPNSLVDEIGNRGNRIVYGDKIEIDKTSLVISNLSVKPNPSFEGRIDISFISSEILSGNSSFIVNGKKQKITSSGKDNGDDTFTYNLSYTIAETEAEGEGELEIEAVDFAGNSGKISTVFNMDVFSPKAKIELSDPSPTGVGEIELKLKTDEKVVSLPSPLRFIDSQGKTHEILLKGEVPGTSFEGIFTVDENVSEGTGYFSFAPETLVDEMGNRRNRIVYGDKIEIDKTSPVISNLSVKPNPSFEGRIDISFISSEILSGNASFIVNGKKQKIISSGKDNGDDTFTYNLSYTIAETEAEGEGELEIEAVDFAGNSGKKTTTFKMDLFAPKATIELSKPSPIGIEEVEVKVFLSEKVFSLPSPLRFTDSKGKVHEIEIKGEIPSTTFSGVFVVNESVSEGAGYFSFAPETLIDEFLNSGNTIIAGEKVEVDKTKPEITSLTAKPNPTSEGKIDISFVSSEVLSASTNVIVNGTSEKLTATGKENGDGTFTYSFAYFLPRGEGEGETTVEIIAVDLAGNAGIGTTLLKLDVFSPMAQIELSKDSPLGLGEVEIKVTTSEAVISVPTPLRYTDSRGNKHEIELSGDVPGTIFEGEFIIDDTVSEGIGNFSFVPDTLIDELENKGNTIIFGNSVEIDQTSPKVTKIKATPNVVRVGPVAISFISSETLSGDTVIMIEDTVEHLLSSGRDNGDGTKTYTYNYLVKPNQNSKKIEVTIDAVDLAGNRFVTTTSFDIDTEVPTASIILSESSPIYTGEKIEVTVTTSEPVIAVPTPLIFTDSASRSIEMELEGEIPGTAFTGTLVVDEDIEEGLGSFSLPVGALVDLAGNRSNTIVSGFHTVIEQVKGIGGWAFPNPFTPNRSGDETDRTRFKILKF